MVYGSETWEMNVEQSARLERTCRDEDGMMDVWCMMCSVELREIENGH